ncbi:MAG: DsbA family protein [Nanoarchaeota archaeon]|nr:DsbA family protein [Nanoarchaeota archaeon]
MMEKEHTRHRKRKGNYWKPLSIVLGVILIFSLYFNISSDDAGEISLDEASESAMDYINAYLLQPGTTASVTGLNEEHDLYNIKLNIGGQEFDSYVTKDGKLLFPSVVLLDEAPDRAGAEDNDGGDVEIELDGRPVKGSEDAKITIVEYASFSCSWCNRVRTTLDQVLEAYPDDVNIIYKHFDRGGSDSMTAQAAECAGDQGKFWEMHDIIFDEGPSGDLDGYADDLGLDTASFSQCLESGKYASLVQQHTQEARSLGMTGTPGFFINGQIVPGAVPFENFKQIIDAELAG